MATAFFEAIMDGLGLVFGDVVENVEMLLLFFAQGCVEFIGDHLVSPALEWQQFSLNIDGINLAITLSQSFEGYEIE